MILICITHTLGQAFLVAALAHANRGILSAVAKTAAADHARNQASGSAFEFSG
jgi:hypothetical protein